jgi:hypothetical protein
VSGAVPRPLVAVVVLLAVAGLVAVALDDGPDHLERARRTMADDEAFAGASTAGEALLGVSVDLERAGDDCDDGDDGDDVTCNRFLVAAALARVASVQVLECRRPDIFTFRAAFRRHLDELADGGDPLPPNLPACD